jgi:hypothetical protein
LLGFGLGFELVSRIEVPAFVLERDLASLPGAFPELDRSLE